MKKFWEVRNEVNSNSEILLYGPIAGEKSWWDDKVTPKDFEADLESLGNKPVTVRVNSPGGDVFAAHAIFNMLKHYKGSVTVVIDGLAASAATIIAMAGDKIVMPSNSLMMIHNPAIGLYDYYSASDLQSVMDALGKIKDSIIAAYRTKCKCTAEEITAMMDAETWLNAEECLEKGFCDKIEGAVSAVLNKNTLVINSVSYDIGGFKNAEGIKNCVKEVNSMNKFEAFIDKLTNLLNVASEPATVQNVAVNTDAGVTASEPAPAPVTNQEDAVAAAVQAERQRVAALDAMAGENAGNAAVLAVINQAKADGKNADDISAYVNALKGINTAAQDNFEAAVKGNKASGVEDVKGNPDDATAANEKDLRAMNAMVEAFNKKTGGK